MHACDASRQNIESLEFPEIEESCHTPVAPKWANIATTGPRREAAVADSLVTTADGLIRALASGAAHIEILEHLDFTKHKPRKDALGQNDAILVIPSTVKSIRVRCSCPRQ